MTGLVMALPKYPVDPFLHKAVLPAIVSDEEIEARINRVELMTEHNSRQIAELRRQIRDHKCPSVKNDDAGTDVSSDPRDSGDNLRSN